MPANLQPITGVDGYIALLQGTSTVALGEACSNITAMPGGSIVYPAKQIYQVTARAHKVLDPRVTPVVYVNGVSISPTQYKIFFGAGIIYFYLPRTETTPVVTIDMAYIPTASATDVVGMLHVNNWQLNLTGNQIQGDEYGKVITPEYRGKLGGTGQFERYSSNTAIDLFNLMLVQSYFIFALYESLSANRLWLCYGDMTSAPMQAPGNGMVGGTVNFVLRETPTFLVEPL
jgi:hypothetical protein